MVGVNMKLKGFDLDLPYVENVVNIEKLMENLNCSYSEAKKIDYNDLWKEKRRNFNLQTRCISAMYERLFKNFNTKDCEKVVVECVAEITQDNIINYLDVYTVQVKFDYTCFINKTNFNKKIYTLELLFEGLVKVAKFKEWNLQPFLETKEEIIKSNYINEWNFKRPVKNSNENYMAEVKCIHGVEDFTITLLVKDLNQNILSSKSITEKPHEFAYAKHLGVVKWTTNDNVMLANKKGDAVITICL